MTYLTCYLQDPEEEWLGPLNLTILPKEMYWHTTYTECFFSVLFKSSFKLPRLVSNKPGSKWNAKVLTFVSVVQIYLAMVNWCAQRGIATICLVSVSISSGTSKLRPYLEKQRKICKPKHIIANKTGLCKKRVILIAHGDKISSVDSTPIQKIASL